MKYKENRDHIGFEVKEDIRKILKEFKTLIPRIRLLPLQLIHNDINKSNVMVEKKEEDH